MIQIPRCYDSHVHLRATGQVQNGLTLFHLHGLDDLSLLRPQAHHFQGDWLVGFGWDQHKWRGKDHGRLPSKVDLDKFFPDFPVFFSRVDGHACWLNSLGVERVRSFLGFSGEHSGIFAEADHIAILSHLPAQSRAHAAADIKAGVDYFLGRGFKFIRDMSCTQEHWEILRVGDHQGKLSLFIEENFTCEKIEDFDQVLDLALRCKQKESPHIRAMGLKFYFDGSLGSETALLSKPYGGSRGFGTQLWDFDDLKSAIQETWGHGLEASVHTIGDEAAHRVAQICVELVRQGAKGKINFEHAQMVRSETIELMKKLSAACHMQPCHWLSDRAWLREKLGDLYKYAFPWRALEDAGVELHFGSDAPIEEASVENNLRTLKLAAEEGIPMVRDPLKYFSH